MKFKISPFLFITLVAFFSMGFIMGILVQMMIIQSTLIKVAEGLEGTNIEVNVDFNETLIVDRIHENLGLDGLNLTEEYAEERKSEGEQNA